MHAQVEVVRCLMDLDGDGLVTMQELVAAIKEAFAARECIVLSAHKLLLPCYA